MWCEHVPGNVKQPESNPLTNHSQAVYIQSPVVDKTQQLDVDNNLAEVMGERRPIVWGGQASLSHFIYRFGELAEINIR